MPLSPPLTGDQKTLENSRQLIETIWSTEVQKQRDPKLIMLDCVETEDFNGEVGEVVKIPIVGEVAVNDKLPGRPVTFQAYSEDGYEMRVTKYKEVSLMFEDLLSYFVDEKKYAYRSIYSERAAFAMARDMNLYILGLRGAVPLIQHIFCTSNGLATGTPLSINQSAILAAKQLLDDADVPDEPGDRFFLTSNGAYNDMLDLEKFINGDYIGRDSMPVPTGQIGTIYGMNVRRTSLIKANTLIGYKNGKDAPQQPTPGVDGAPHVPSQESLISWNNGSATINGLPRGQTGSELTAPFVTSMVGHRAWAKFAIRKRPKIESGRLIEYQSDVLVSTQIFDGKTYRQDHIVLIHHAP